MTAASLTADSEVPGNHPPAARCVVVDDHPIVRKGFVALIRELGVLDVVGEAGDVAAARSVIEQCQPDILVIDLVLKGVAATEFIKELRARFPALKVLVVSMMDETVYGPRLLQAGAHGFIMKGAAAEEIERAIRTVLGGGLYLNPELAALIVRNGNGGSKVKASIAEVLTDRELEVLRLIGEGRTTKEIAGTLSISTRTVDAHKANIRGKLNVRTMAELSKCAALWVRQLAQ